MVINAGKYNVFNEDGTLFQWGGQSTHASVTTNNRLRLFIGDNEEPVLEKIMPKSVRTLNDFDKFTLMVFQSAQVLYATQLMMKLHKFREAYQQIIDQKSVIQGQMMLGMIPVWRWIERLKELNEFQEICEDLMKKTMETLQKLAPNMLTEEFIIIYTED